ncbi:MAG: symmetrical bis(5'-nucleosyl)-tetraphosphatase [Nitrospinae bacterium]|nr:symmetrical bis(5'-nucleosyl)-tetraphosphatase [Nitrospinota bacterium]
MAIYAIGDIQGCFEPLQRLLAAMEFNPASDKLWLTGDMVNRGEDSLKVLRLAMSLGTSCVAVLGNHEIHMLAVYAGARHIRHKDTFQDILSAPDAGQIIDWLRRRPLLYAEGEYFLVHAGLMPQWSAQDALKHAAEAESVLRSHGWKEAMAGFFGDGPDHWDENLPGMERIRSIVNAMVRMRVITMHGKMDLSFTGPPAEAPPGYIPWSLHPGRMTKDKVVVCGHWAAQGAVIREDMIALDSGCGWKHGLTGARLDDRKMFFVMCQ